MIAFGQIHSSSIFLQLYKVLKSMGIYKPFQKFMRIISCERIGSINPFPWRMEIGISWRICKSSYYETGTFITYTSHLFIPMVINYKFWCFLLELVALIIRFNSCVWSLDCSFRVCEACEALFNKFLIIRVYFLNFSAMTVSSCFVVPETSRI